MRYMWKFFLLLMLVVTSCSEKQIDGNVINVAEAMSRLSEGQSVQNLYLEPHNNQKQSEISKRKSLITNTFYKLTLFGCFLSLPKFPHIFDTYF